LSSNYHSIVNTPPTPPGGAAKGGGSHPLVFFLVLASSFFKFVRRFCLVERKKKLGIIFVFLVALGDIDIFW
jgi:hypothetical protein